MKYYFIVNPQSRSGKAGLIWIEVEKQLTDKDIPYSVHFTSYRGDAKHYTKQLTERPGHKEIVVLGGDGTLNEVVCGINDFSAVTLGYIPTGSGNDFAKGLGLPSDPLQALDRILSGNRVVSVDVGMLTMADRRSRSFIVSSGIGLDASVCHQSSVSPVKKLLNHMGLGKLSYPLLALHQLLICKPFGMEITIDDKTYNYEKVFLTAVMNMPYQGGGCMFSPKAAYDDRLLDICIVEGMGKLKILFLLPTVFLGKHTFFHGVHLLKGKTVTIKADSPRIVHTDGETFNPKKYARMSIKNTPLHVYH